MFNFLNTLLLKGVILWEEKNLLILQSLYALLRGEILLGFKANYFNLQRRDG